MFWDDEAIELASNTAVEILGKQGQYSIGDQLHCVYVENLGKIWYGDLELSANVRDVLEELRDRLKQTIYVLKDTRIDDDRSFMNQSVMTVEF